MCFDKVSGLSKLLKSKTPFPQGGQFAWKKKKKGKKELLVDPLLTNYLVNTVEGDLSARF